MKSQEISAIKETKTILLKVLLPTDPEKRKESLDTIVH